MGEIDLLEAAGYIMFALICIIVIIVAFTLMILILSNVVGINSRLLQRTRSEETEDEQEVRKAVKPVKTIERNYDSLTSSVQKKQKSLILDGNKYLSARLADGTELKLRIVRDDLLL